MFSNVQAGSSSPTVSFLTSPGAANSVAKDNSCFASSFSLNDNAELSRFFYGNFLTAITCGSRLQEQGLCIPDEGAPLSNPEIDVIGNAVSIADGDVAPSTSDHTQFPNTLACTGTSSRTFTIENTGTAVLNLSGTPIVQVSGPQAAEFTVTTQPPATVAINGSVTFTVTFDPSSVSAHDATLSIDNDDTNEDPYDFVIRGQGTPDNDAPTITCPAAQTGSVDASCGFLLPDLTTLATGVGDNCPTAPTVTQSPAIGTSIPVVGTATTVTLYATDGSTNVDSCSFTHTTADNTMPTAVCQDISIQLSGGTATIVASDINNGSSDNCGLGAITASTTSFTCAEVGANSVTLTVNDVNSNSSTCTAMVTVQDTTIPTATCQDITVQLDAGGNGTAGGGDVNNGSTDDCTSVLLSLSQTSFSCADLGTNSVTLTVSDASTNQATCTAMVTVEDNVDPVITCPAQQSTFVDGNCQATVPDLASLGSATDNCATSPTVTQSPTLGATISSATTTVVTLTTDDGNGNTANCTFNFVTQDTTRPALTCPSGTTIFMDDSCMAAVPDFLATTTTSDNCSSNPTLLQTPAAASTVTGSGFLAVIITSTDDDGNVADCQISVTKSDTTRPSVTCPTNLDLPANTVCQVSLPNFASTLSATDNCDPNPGAFQTPVAGTILNGVGATANVTLIVNDLNSNAKQCDFVVTVTDTTSPVTTCPANQTIAVDANCAASLPNYIPQTSIGDNCDGNPTVVQSPALNTPLSANNPPVTVTITATDASTNTNSCSFTVTPTDNIAPTITCPPNETVFLSATCNTTMADYSGATTTADNCTVSLPVTQSPLAGSVQSGVGSQTVTLSIEDASTNSANCTLVVTRQDTTRPSLTCPANQNLLANQSCSVSIPDFSSQTTLSDNCDSSPSLSQSPVVNTTLNGAGTTQVITMTANDASTNSTSCTFTVTVTDQTAPSVSCPANQTLVGDANCQIIIPDYLPQVSIADNCDGNPTLAQSPASGTTASGAGTVVTVTATGTDISANAGNCTFTVTIIDNDNPTIVCPANQTLIANASCQATLPSFVTQATIADNCDPNPSVVQAPSAATTISGAGTVTNVTLTITDGSANTSNCSFTVTLQDQTAPNLSCPPNQNIIANSNCQVNLPSFVPTVSDNCDANPVIVQSPIGGTLVSGAGTAVNVSFSATDASSNIANCAFVATVIDTTSPGITCPPNETIYVNGSCTVSLPDYSPQTTSSDNCTAAVTVTQSPPASQSFTAGNSVPVTMTGTDDSNNAANCIFTVIVQDTTRPSLICPATQMLQVDSNCSAVVPDYRSMATSSDNCTATPLLAQIPAPGMTVNSPVVQTLSITSTDFYGNVDTCTFSLAVQDTFAPTITCPAPQTLVLGNNCTTIMTDYIPGTSSTDNCTAAPTITQQPTPGSTINGSGILPVTLTADDGNGNTTSCSLNVTVFDLVAPIITCPPGDSLLTNSNCAGNIPNYTGNATVIDNCSAQISLTQNPVPGTVVTGSGAITTVVLTAVDSTGNMDTCHVMVTLIDNVAPVISGCPSNFVVTPTSLNCSPPATWTPPIASDVCGATLTSTHQPGDNFPLGTTTVTYNAADSSGNSATCSFTVTINAPQLDNVITVSNPNPCDGDSATLTASSGSIFSWSTTDTTSSIVVTQSGTYWVDLTDSSNCTGRDSVDIVFEPLPVPVIVQSGGDLCASTTFPAYQWFLNGTAIPGATGNCVTPTTNGNYTVLVTATNQCEGESAVFMYVAADEAMSAQGFEVFPNPTRDLITVRMEQPLLSPGEIVVYDLRSREVFRSSFDRIDSSIRIDLSDLTDGTYLLEIESKEFTGRTRVIRMR